MTLSRKLQYAAERHSGAFADAMLKSDIATIQRFLSTYSSHRFLYLRRIRFKTSIPSIENYDDEGYPEQDCRDTENDLWPMDEEFSKQMSVLFRTLSTLETRVCALYGPGNIHLTVYTPTHYLHDGECFHRKYSSWRVRLL